MSLTTPNYWKYSAKSTSQKESWLVQLGYGTGSSFVGVSDRDIKVSSVQYHGLVVDFGNIVENVNISESSSSISNLTITLKNQFASGRLSDRFFTSVNTTEHINRDVDIYSLMGDTTTLSDCVLIYQGRIISVGFDKDFISIECEQRTPFDFIQIPNERYLDFYKPVIYGEYAGGTISTVGSPDFIDAVDVWPAPVIRRNNNLISCLFPFDIGAHNLYLYEKNIDKFAFLSANLAVLGSTNYTGVQNKDLDREFYVYPELVADTNDFTNPLNAVDGNTSNYADEALSVSGAGVQTDNKYLEFDMPQPAPGIITTYNIYVSYRTQIICNDIDTTVADTAFLRLDDDSYGGTVVPIYQLNSSASGGAADSDENPSWTGYDNNTVSLLAKYTGTSNTLPSSFKIRAQLETDAVSSGASATATVRINDIYVHYRLSMDYASEPQASESEIDKLERIYCDDDGLTKGYNGGSGTATLIHEIHRDMMDRYAGVDYSDANMSGWSSLNTDRASWNAHVWHIEQVYLKDVLEQLQKEGGFVFMFKPDGGRYVHVENSYSSGDVVHTITIKDTKNLPSVYHTPFSRMQTYIKYEYNKHPGKDNVYRDTDELQNTTARSVYNVNTEENIRTIKLDYNYGAVDGGSNPNDDLANYIDNIVAEPKILVDCEIINTAMFNIEIGDIVKFSIDEYSPFAKTWASVYFMVQQTDRRPNSMRITAREVYTS